MRPRIDGCRGLERERGPCIRCGADFFRAQCVHFDTGAPSSVTSGAARISPKDARNTCALFEPRTTVERETKSAAPSSARKAFDDLFK